jgi:hypothetical protein
MTTHALPDILEDDIPKPRAIQNISGRYINQSKLTAMLRMKFGAGAYDFYVSYSHDFGPVTKRLN